MATSATPVLIRTFYTLAKASLSDRLVTVGYRVTGDPNQNALMVCVNDPDNLDAAQSGDADQEMATAGTPRSRSQTGSIPCAALSWSGDASDDGLLDCIDAAYATYAAAENLLRADPRMGLSTYSLLVVQIGEERLATNQFAATADSAGGAEALLTFSVDFEARI